MEKRITGSVKFIYTISFLLFSVYLNAQTTEKQIEVGGWVKLVPCKKENKSFVSMDLYTKTRYPESGIAIDSTTGNGVFENFFAPGDFDAKRLPCEFGNKKYRIAALRVFEVEGKEKQVMILYTGNKLSMIWVEIDKAVELNEIIF